MGRIGMPELLVILVIVLLIFGANKIPQIARSLGQGIKEFRKVGKDTKDEIGEEEPKPKKK
ncbi:MAG: twin-arginine translocase TatA/TatE family subunit [Candidatus Stahlbacteria bacterium]|nr:twin-arginine translocase TatA/TatE family subunit [Candidatus Stahlbacteria bacterium]